MFTECFIYSFNSHKDVKQPLNANENKVGSDFCSLRDIKIFRVWTRTNLFSWTCRGQRSSGVFANYLDSEEWGGGGGRSGDTQVIMKVYKYDCGIKAWAWSVRGIWWMRACSLTWSPSPSQVTGVVLLSVGLWWKFMLGPYMLLMSDSPSNGPYVLTGTGVAIVLFGLFGCFATCKGRPWMLKLVRFSNSWSTLLGPCARLDGWFFDSLFSLQVRHVSGSGLHDGTHRRNLRIHFSSWGYKKTQNPNTAHSQTPSAVVLATSCIHACRCVSRLKEPSSWRTRRRWWATMDVTTGVWQWTAFSAALVSAIWRIWKLLVLNILFIFIFYL